MFCEYMKTLSAQSFPIHETPPKSEAFPVFCGWNVSSCLIVFMRFFIGYPGSAMEVKVL